MFTLLIYKKKVRFYKSVYSLREFIAVSLLNNQNRAPKKLHGSDWSNKICIVMIGQLIRNAMVYLDFYNDLQNLSFCQRNILFIDLHIK